MNPVTAKSHHISSSKYNNSHAISSGGFTDEQLRNMAAPQRVNGLQWSLSTPQEKRQMLDTLAQNTADSETNSGAHGQLHAKNITTSGTIVSFEKGAVHNKTLKQFNTTDITNNPATNIEAAIVLQTAAEAKPVQITTRQESDKPALDDITRQFKQRFSASAENKSEFHGLMQKSFGHQYDFTKAETMRQQSLQVDFSWLPEIKLVDSAQLKDVSLNDAGTGLGAYSKDSDAIYLSRELLRSNSVQAEKILSEEIGHAIDARINVEATRGDEGDIFSRFIHGEDLSAAELKELQQENNTGTIEINGEQIEVEYSLFSKIKKGIKKIGKKIKGGVKCIGKGIRKVGKSIVKGVKKVGKLLVKGVKKIGKAIKKGLQKLMQSKLFNAILMVAQFIPIPVVQLAVRAINIVKAAYNVYQGVKHKSWGAVLGGLPESPEA